MNTSRTTKEIKNDFLNQLSLLVLADSPLKTQIQKFADNQRGKLVAQIAPERRELYLGAKDVIIALADQLIKAEDLEQVAKVLKVIQGITQGKMYEYEDPNDEAVSKGVKDLLFNECNLILDNVITARLIATVRGLNTL